MDQIKDRIKLVDTTLLSLEQVYTTLSHVSLKKKNAFLCLLRSYFIVGVHNKSVRKGGRSKLFGGQNCDIYIYVANFCFCSLDISAKNEGGHNFPPQYRRPYNCC